MPTNVIMPQLGESVVEGTVSRWLKNVGDRIEAFEPLLEVSTDKVDSEIPSPAEGVLLQILVPEGETVERGTVLAMIGGEGETVPHVPVVEAITSPPVPLHERGEKDTDAKNGVPTNGMGEHGAYTGHVTPVVARMAAEHQIDLAQIEGTGRGGRVTKKDVEAYLGTRDKGLGTRETLEAASSKPQATSEKITSLDTSEVAPWDQPMEGADLFKPTVDYSEAASETMTSPPAPLRVRGEKDNAGEGREVTDAPLRVPTGVVGEGETSPPTPLHERGETSATIPGRLHPVEGIPDAAAGELVRVSAMRRSIAEHMVRSKLHTSPHVTTVFEVDLGAILAHREDNKADFAKQGVNLTLTAYFVAASVAALRAVPYLNAEWRDDGIYLHREQHIGIAVALDEGLIVPVIKRAGDLNLLGMARSVNDLAARARTKALKPDEVQGGTFTITNHGVSGSLFATPIINQPQVGILGVGVMEKRVKVITDAARNDMIAIRPCAYVSLTFDHRVVDGAAGDAFMMTVKKTLEDWK